MCRFVVSLSSTQPGASLEQTHIFVLAHILRRPIIVYGVKYYKSFRGETLGYTRFQGEAAGIVIVIYIRTFTQITHKTCFFLYLLWRLAWFYLLLTNLTDDFIVSLELLSAEAMVSLKTVAKSFFN